MTILIVFSKITTYYQLGIKNNKSEISIKLKETIP